MKGRRQKNRCRRQRWPLSFFLSFLFAAHVLKVPTSILNVFFPLLRKTNHLCMIRRLVASLHNTAQLAEQEEKNEYVLHASLEKEELEGFFSVRDSFRPRRPLLVFSHTYQAHASLIACFSPKAHDACFGEWNFIFKGYYIQYCFLPFFSPFISAAHCYVRLGKQFLKKKRLQQYNERTQTDSSPHAFIAPILPMEEKEEEISQSSHQGCQHEVCDCLRCHKAVLLLNMLGVLPHCVPLNQGVNLHQ